MLDGQVRGGDIQDVRQVAAAMQENQVQGGLPETGGAVGAVAIDRRSWGVSEPREALSVELSTALVDLDGKLAAACELWRLWGQEEGRQVDEVGFAREVVSRTLTGTGTVLVAFTEAGRPVGMVSIGWDYDPARSRKRVMAERLFVIPEYRNRSVWDALHAAGLVYAYLVGGDEHVVSCRAGSRLQSAYEARGFRVTDYVLKRDAESTRWE